MIIISLLLKELNASTLNTCWKKIWPFSAEIKNILESSENEIGSILELAKSIRCEGFPPTHPSTIKDIQDL